MLNGTNVCEHNNNKNVIKPGNYILFNLNSVVFFLHDQFFRKLLFTEILFPVMGFMKSNLIIWSV